MHGLSRVIKKILKSTMGGDGEEFGHWGGGPGLRFYHPGPTR